MHRGSFGSQLRPIQHPPGCRGGHSDRNCVRFSTHQGVRKPVFDVPKKMTQNKNACFLGFCRPKILGREKSEPHGNHFCVPLRFRRSRGNKKQQTRAGTAPMPNAAGFLPRLMPHGHEWSSNGPSEVPVQLTWLKFAARVSSFYAIVPCWLPEVPRKAMKGPISDLKAIEEAMKQLVPEKKARIIAMPPGSKCGGFYKRVFETIP